MRTIFQALMAFMLIVGATSSSAYAEPKSLNKDLRMQVANLFWKKDYAQLHKTLETFRNQNSRTSYGGWKSNIFYKELANLVSPKFADASTWNGAFQKAEDWIKAYPNVPSGYLAKAGFLHQYAGKHLSDNPKIRPPAAYYEDLKKARDYLLSTEKVSGLDPEWYVRMMLVLKDLNVKPQVVQKVMEEGVARYPEYGPIYLTGVKFLLPIWRGDRKKVETFANAVVKRTTASEGYGMFVRVYWLASELREDKGALFKDKMLDWAKMKKGIQDNLAKYPDPWNINKYGYIACLAQDRQLTRELINQIKRPISHAWKMSFKDCKKFAGSDDELSLRDDIQKEVIKLFWRSDFPRLNNLADQYRKSEARTGSGLWKLSLFYSGISGAMASQKESPEAWQKAFEVADNWIKAYPKSPAAHITKAKLLNNYAVKFRGSGWAREVPKEAWAIINQYNSDAKKHLLETKDISSQDPEWYAQMFSVLLYQSDADSIFETYLAEGMKKHPRYYGLYFRAAIYLQPVWHGSKEAVEALADKAVNNTKSTDGMSLYARIYWYLSSIVDRRNLYSEFDVNWNKMKQGMHDVHKKYPDQWNVNNFAFFACLAQDQKTTQLYFNKLTKPQLDIWYGGFETCKNFASQK